MEGFGEKALRISGLINKYQKTGQGSFMKLRMIEALFLSGRGESRGLTAMLS